jgi:predicted nucleic acid-binding protein
MDAAPRNIIIDAGPLAAAISAGDPHHAWAGRALLTLRGHLVTCEAAITEAQHILKNNARALGALRLQVARMSVAPLSPTHLDEVFAESVKYAPRMDFADACAVVLARLYPRAFVLTTDFKDFSTYRVPFASPAGAFHN